MYESSQDREHGDHSMLRNQYTEMHEHMLSE